MVFFCFSFTCSTRRNQQAGGVVSQGLAHPAAFSSGILDNESRYLGSPADISFGNQRHHSFPADRKRFVFILSIFLSRIFARRVSHLVFRCR